MKKATRYELIAGDAIWIVDRVETWRNALFTLGRNDRNHADGLLRNLNAIPNGRGVAMPNEAGHATAAAPQ